MADSDEGVSPPPQQWVPSFNPWLVAISVMLATVMEVLESVSRTPRLVAITVPEGLRNELSSSNRHRDQVEE